MARVILIDDHLIVRQGVRSVVESVGDNAVVAEFSDGAVFLRSRELLPSFDLLFLDSEMPHSDGLWVLFQLSRWNPPPPAILLSNDGNRLHALEALAAGARGYLTKDSDARSFQDAIRTVLDGGLYFESSGRTNFLSDTVRRTAGEGQESDDTRLTSFEWVLLSRIRAGCTSREIMEEFSITAEQVDAYRTVINEKLSRVAALVAGVGGSTG